MVKETIKKQIHDNLIAIISLTVAIVALFYNTWRNEHTEKNRNIRPAAFEVLNQLGQLQLVINNIRYLHIHGESSNPIMGWGHVSFVSDLSQILPPPVPAQIGALVQVWQDNWQSIQTNESSADKITHEIDASRATVLEQLKNLK